MTIKSILTTRAFYLLLFANVLASCRCTLQNDECYIKDGKLMDGVFWTLGEQELRDATARFFVDYCNESGYVDFSQKCHEGLCISLHDAISSPKVAGIVDLFFSDNLFWNAVWGDPKGDDRRWWRNWVAKGGVTAFRSIEQGGNASVILLICYGERDGYHDINRNKYNLDSSARDNYFKREIIYACGMFDENSRVIGLFYGSETVGDICAKGVLLFRDVDGAPSKAQ